MGGTDWTDVEAIFAAALELAPADRAALLDARCTGRADLRQQVESLLASHDRAGEFLNGAAIETITDRRPELTGRTIGGFRLFEPIGRGGMGVVYRGERVTSEFTQQAAVKVIEAPLVSPDMLRHFKTERQILAALRHPHIVTLIDGGISPEGFAYLVMEYVDGAPITAHAASRELPLDERMRLMQRVCGAVQFAHQHAVVHRDLKPANILVTPDGVPKVLDFGVAKLLDTSNSGGSATMTALWQRGLTPNYASPEQLRGLPVTTACDIYALGVLLYELLAGVRPYDTTGKPLDEILRLVTDVEPRRPALGADLDAIVLKAMSKDPARRYASAQELSEDLGRYLARQPVVAREPSFGYLFAKAAERHRAAFAAAAISIVALLAALGVSLWARHVAVVERNRATARFNEVRQIANAMIFKIEPALQPLAGSTPLRKQIVSEALTYLERLRSDPNRDDGLSLEMARAYHRVGEVQGNQAVPNLGDRDAAIDSYHRAIELLTPITKSPAVGHDATVELGRVQVSLAVVANGLGRRDQMLAAADAAGAVAESLMRQNPKDDEARRLAASVAFQIASASGHLEALLHYERARDLFVDLLNEKPDDADRQRNVALTEKYIGSAYQQSGDYTSAVEHFLRAKDLDERRLNAQPANRSAQFDVAIDLGNVAFAERRTGHLADGASHWEQSLEMRKRLADSDPGDVLARGRVAYAHTQLGFVYADLGQLPRALDHAREAARLSETMANIDVVHGEQFADALWAVAETERRMGRGLVACESYHRAVGIVNELAARPGLAPDMVERLTSMQRNLEAAVVTHCGRN
ncbi:MAG TPA: serine/threonine-protein kinase [Vicinamibacterales bacterium]|nr:serine/threonine-protein kinase [Vicinamibacterales bacterium]